MWWDPGEAEPGIDNSRKIFTSRRADMLTPFFIAAFLSLSLSFSVFAVKVTASILLMATVSSVEPFSDTAPFTAPFTSSTLARFAEGEVGTGRARVT
eukprot:CAMPEP_0118669876 /NCGR_PEP_ID=MMETSP0785-20121206/21143_1 /TAXON_ID=91992 /ORGANISM="Bolidomonas pacifica, Strain CCMP 1866" /LENGTH=96 /DNA_ID=CAMNT_0006564605 /DNA_START=506 /DNA_END=792 /DNA_ORIENTATION=+